MPKRGIPLEFASPLRLQTFKGFLPRKRAVWTHLERDFEYGDWSRMKKKVETFDLFVQGMVRFSLIVCFRIIQNIQVNQQWVSSVTVL